MKTQIFKLTFLALMLFSLNSLAERISKRVYRSYAIGQVAKLELSNKYGNIRIDENRKDSVVVGVEIWVDGSGSKAQKLLDNITVNISQSGKTVSATTEFRNEFNNSSQDFSVDYQVSVPADRDLTVSQKYGTVSMNNLTGKGIFDIKYGELRAKNLLASALSMDIAYSKVYADATNDLDLTIRYSKLNIGKGDNLKIDSRYSGLIAGNCKEVILDSKYDDIKFKTINSLASNSMYSGYKIESILSFLVLSNGYGDFSVGAIPIGFKSIKVDSRYATVKLGIETGASYRLDGKARYCDLKHPEGKLNRAKEDTSYEVHGTVGAAENPRSVVTIDSSYGNVRLMP